MESKLSAVADYLDSRRKSSSYESHRLREVESNKEQPRAILLNAGSNYMNLKAAGVILKTQKFAEVDFGPDDEGLDPSWPSHPGYEGDPEMMDYDPDSEVVDESSKLSDEDDIFGDEDDIFAGEEGDDEDSFLDLSSQGEPGELSFNDSSLDREEDPLQFDGELSSDPLASDDAPLFDEGEYDVLAKQDPREVDYDRPRAKGYGLHHQLASRKNAWLKEAVSEGVFKNI